MENRERVNRLRRERRNKFGNVYEVKYSKTINGLLCRIYHNMKGRISGVQKKDYPYLYAGKELIDRYAFYEWAKTNEEFNKLYISWIESGCDRKIVPSIDRKDSSIGYVLGNMQWVTFSENCRGEKQWKNRFGVKRSEESKLLQSQTNMKRNRCWFEKVETKERYFLSPTEMFRMFGGCASAYTKVKNGKLNKTNGFAHIEIESTGNFTVHNKQIIHGKIH